MRWANSIYSRSGLYTPDHEYSHPSDPNVAYGTNELKITTADGLALPGCYVAAASKPYTIFFFHGSGDSLTKAAGTATPYTRAGYGVLLAEYRGYGRSPGTPTEQGLYEDGARFFVHCRQWVFHQIASSFSATPSGQAWQSNWPLNFRFGA